MPEKSPYLHQWVANVIIDGFRIRILIVSTVKCEHFTWRRQIRCIFQCDRAVLDMDNILFKMKREKKVKHCLRRHLYMYLFLYAMHIAYIHVKTRLLTLHFMSNSFRFIGRHRTITFTFSPPIFIALKLLLPRTFSTNFLNIETCNNF